MIGCALPVFMRVLTDVANKYAFFMEQKASVDPVAFLNAALTFDQAAMDLPRATALVHLSRLAVPYGRAATPGTTAA